MDDLLADSIHELEKKRLLFLQALKKLEEHVENNPDDERTTLKIERMKQAIKNLEEEIQYVLELS